MDTVTITPSALAGTIPAIASKSHVHRLLICAALSDAPHRIVCRGTSRDIEATARCLSALGAELRQDGDGYLVTPLQFGNFSEPAVLDCGESGSTYRFLAPLVCALGARASFSLAGKLPHRPMEPLLAALESHGAVIGGRGTAAPALSGPISPGCYELPGNLSSQFFSGLLFALPLLSGQSELVVKGRLQSGGYLQMTRDTLHRFSVETEQTPVGFRIPGGQRYHCEKTPVPEGDWSNAAFFLCAAACRGSGITITGLPGDTVQGDRAICALLREFGAKVRCEKNAVTVRPGVLHPIRLDAGDIPDLVPALAVAAAGACGTSVFENIGRLRLKESDRAETVCGALRALGASAEVRENRMEIHGHGQLSGGTADACGDHRIAMLLAAASVLCRTPVTIIGAGAVGKSYPGFFEDFAALGGRTAEGEKAL